MSDIEITLPDNSVQKFRKGIKGIDIAKKIGKKLAEDALAIELNGKLKPLETQIEENSKIKIITRNSKEGLEVLRHSASHVMAEAVKELWPQVKLGIGPSIEDGFYYDFFKKEPFSNEDLKKIEEKMKEIIKGNKEFKRKEMNKGEARKFFEQKGEKFKVELLNELEEGKISFYESGKFMDLCKGPHLKKTGEIKAFKLLSTGGAYWKGDEKNEMLQRVYGTAFFKEKDLEEFLKQREEAEKRDHRKIGKELDLFSINEIVGSGFILWHPKGTALRNAVMKFDEEEHIKRGYEFVTTPHIFKADTWKVSGHYNYYKDNMYFLEIDKQEYGVKPMNCPAHIMIYKSNQHSYRELPIKYFEFGTVYRYEKSGVLGGLFRVRGFTQDDAHIFCSLEQLKEEIKKVIEFCTYTFKVFGFNEVAVKLSTKPEKAIGTKEQWDKAETALKTALNESKIEFEVEEGEGVFYGPKIDFKVKDSIKREWQLSTIQVDFNLPERFDTVYIASDSKKHRVVMIHRAIFGSLERFIGILIEHFEGKFPLWLSPIQFKILAVGEKFEEYAEQVSRKLTEEGFRTELDLRGETVSYKIREGQMQKIPYIIVVGEREKENNTVTVRDRTGQQKTFSLEEFIEEKKNEIKEKK
jgi:threonyl-tRNA synthetase